MLLKDKESYRTVSRLISSDLIMDIVDNFSFFFLSLSTFIYLFIFFSPSCYFEVGIYKPLSFDLDLFFRRSGQFLDTCSAVQR